MNLYFVYKSNQVEISIEIILFFLYFVHKLNQVEIFIENIFYNLNQLEKSIEIIF